jgi:hypothetical protein
MSNKKTLVVVGSVVTLAIFVAVVAIGCVGIINTEVKLANRYEAQFNVVETTLDNMRKTIMNQHKCTKEWADKFIAVVSKQAEGRSGMSGRVKGGGTGGVAAVAASGGTGFTFARESEALGIPQDLYLKLSNSIEGKLAEFKRSQDVLTDVWRSHKTHCQVFPNSLFVGDKVKEKPEMISSEVAKEAMKTKKLDDDLL